MPTTNVPPVSFSPLGFIAPSDEAILAGVLADYAAAFAITGYNLNPALNTPQGQLASSTAALVSDADQTFLYYTTQVDPSYAQGRMQDAIGRIYFLQRNPAEPTALQVQCSGAPGVLIPLGSLVQDNAGNTYSSTGSGTIGPGGNVTIGFANLIPGPIAVPSSLTIYQAIPGWDSASVVSGDIGQNTETSQQFEARRSASVAVNSIGSVPSVLGAVLSVPGVLDAYVTENATSGTATVGGVVLAANSLYVAVTGGSASAIAEAIWTKKAPGCAYNGNTTVTVYDSNSGYSPPYPSYQVTFEIPSSLPIFFTVTIKNSTLVPSNAIVQIQNALQAAFAGGSGVPKARIGSTLYATQYVSPITSLGTWAEAIISLQIGSANTPAAVFTGSCGGTTLHVTGLTSGTIGAGDWLVSGSSVTGTAAFLPGTQIIVQVSGTAGGVGIYQVSVANTVPSQSVSAVLANGNLVSVNINQEPTLNNNDISLVLQ